MCETNQGQQAPASAEAMQWISEKLAKELGWRLTASGSWSQEAGCEWGFVPKEIVDALVTREMELQRLRALTIVSETKPEGQPVLSAEQYFDAWAPFHWNKADVVVIMEKFAQLCVAAAVEAERDEFHKQLKEALGIPDDGKIWFGTGLLAVAKSLRERADRAAAAIEAERERCLVIVARETGGGAYCRAIGRDIERAIRTERK